MSNRGKDWLRQALKELKHAINVKEDEDYEWSCFASQQSAEKALKVVYYQLNKEAWGAFNQRVAGKPTRGDSKNKRFDISCKSLG